MSITPISARTHYEVAQILRDHSLVNLLNMGRVDELPAFVPEQAPALREKLDEVVESLIPAAPAVCCTQGHEIHPVIGTDLDVECRRRAQKLKSGAIIKLPKKLCTTCQSEYNARRRKGTSTSA